MTEYVVLFEKGDTRWGAYVLDLPGCVAVAKKREETERLIRDAIVLHSELMREDGDPIPEPTTEAVRVAV